MDLAEARVRRDAAARHPWELARLDVLKKLVAHHVTLAPDSVVMDVGCGDTFIVDQLAAEHPRTRFYAVDTAFTDEAVAGARRGPEGNVHCYRSLDAVRPPLERQASLVLLMDVIEHIEDERGFLADLVRRPYIGRHTRFVVTAPAYQALFCSHDTFLGHHRRYSPAMLQARLEDAGLAVVDAGRFFFSLVPVRVLRVLKERLLGASSARGTTGLVTWNGGHARTGALRRLLALDASAGFLLKRAGVDLPGLSAYVVCRKAV